MAGRADAYGVAAWCQPQRQRAGRLLVRRKGGQRHRGTSRADDDGDLGIPARAQLAQHLGAPLAREQLGRGVTGALAQRQVGLGQQPGLQVGRPDVAVIDGPRIQGLRGLEPGNGGGIVAGPSQHRALVDQRIGLLDRRLRPRLGRRYRRRRGRCPGRRDRGADPHQRQHAKPAVNPLHPPRIAEPARPGQQPHRGCRSGVRRSNAESASDRPRSARPSGAPACARCPVRERRR